MAALTVSDALLVPPLRGAEPSVVAGADGLGAPVRWVHSTELVDIAPLLRGGDLVLSTGIALPGDEAGLRAFVASLHHSEAAGLVIELGRRWHRLPAALIEACDALSLPLVALAREVRFAAVAQAIGEQIVDQQLAELRAAQRVHEVFTDLGTDEAGPDEILEATAGLAGAAVVLEDRHHSITDYRPGPHEARTVLADWQARSRKVRLGERTGWDQANGWLVTRIGRADRGWGRLVILTDHQPSERMLALAERAAAALALHRLHDRNRDSPIRRRHTELLMALLTDPTSPGVLEGCEVAGLPVRGRQFVGLVLRPARVEGANAAGSLLDDLTAAVVHSVAEARTAALVAVLDGDVRMLVSLPEAQDSTADIDALAQRVHRRQSTLIAAGQPATGPADIDRTLREAVQVLHSVRDQGVDRPVHRLADVHLRGLLALLADDDRLDTFARRELGVLRDHDLLHGGGLLDAVRALVTHPGSKTEAAASLHLSRAGFYDRVDRVQRLLGVDLDDPDTRVSLHVALLAEEINGQQG